MAVFQKGVTWDSLFHEQRPPMVVFQEVMTWDALFQEQRPPIVVFQKGMTWDYSKNKDWDSLLCIGTIP